MTDWFDLSGVTGADLGWARRASSIDDADIHTTPSGFAKLICRVPVSEPMLHGWWARLRSCWPTPEKLEDGYMPPHYERRTLHEPTIGFCFAGDVEPRDGATVCWYSGTVRVGFSGRFSVFRFDLSHDDTSNLRFEVKSRLPPNSSEPNAGRTSR